MCKFI
jgi:hypothetical protein